MAYKITGRIISVGNTQELTAKSGNRYTQRDFVMTVRKFDPYTGQPADDDGNTPKFSLFGERCNDLNGIFKGDVVTVSFEVRGRAYDKNGQTEYFTEIRPLRVERLACGSIQPAQPDLSAGTVEVAEPYGQKVSVAELMEGTGKEKKLQEPSSEEDDDLPF